MLQVPYGIEWNYSPLNWAASKDFNLSYFNEETLSYSLYTHNIVTSFPFRNSKPEKQPRTWAVATSSDLCGATTSGARGNCR